MLNFWNMWASNSLNWLSNWQVGLRFLKVYLHFTWMSRKWRGIAGRTNVYRPISSDITVRGCTMSFSESRRARPVPPSPTNRLPTKPWGPYNCDGGFTSTSQSRVQQDLGSPPLAALHNRRPHINLTKQPPDLLNVT
jgi:hypothetical protein